MGVIMARGFQLAQHDRPSRQRPGLGDSKCNRRCHGNAMAIPWQRHGIARARHSHTQQQNRHPTTRQTPNYKTDTQLQEFHQMRTQSRNPRVNQKRSWPKARLKKARQTPNYKTDTQLQDRHPTTGQAPNYRSSNPIDIDIDICKP